MRKPNNVAKRIYNSLQPDGTVYCGRCGGNFDKSHFYQQINPLNGNTKYRCKGKYLTLKPKKVKKELPRHIIQEDGRIKCWHCNEIFDKSHFNIQVYPGRKSNPNKEIVQYICKKNDKRRIVNQPRKYKSNFIGDDENYQKDRDMQREYGITLDYYNQLFAEQNGCCAICGKHQTEFKKALHIDHDHDTLKVRGLLCGRCNMGIGLFDDASNLLNNCVLYLQKYGK